MLHGLLPWQCHLGDRKDTQNRDQTCTTCCITTNVLQTNKVDSQSGKLAIESNYADNVCAKSRQFSATLPAFGASTGGDFVGVLPRFSPSENKSPWAIMWRCSHDPTFSRV